MSTEPPATNESRVGWCVTHKCVAVVYGDGSWSCWHEKVCEYRDSDHLVDLLPQDQQMNQRWAQSVFGTRLRAWAGRR